MANTDAVESGSSSLEQGAGNLAEMAAQGGFSADVSELVAYIRGLRGEADSLVEDGIQFRDFANFTESAVSDPVTTEYFAFLTKAFGGFAAHGGRMYEYTDAYVNGLTQSAKAMNDLDDGSQARYVVEPPGR